VQVLSNQQKAFSWVPAGFILFRLIVGHLRVLRQRMDQPIRSFQEAVKSIDKAYRRIGLKSSWRFLYTPKRTFSKGTRLFFIGTNPGGRHGGKPELSVETGNAYRLERWPADRKDLNKLQTQVCRFFEGLAHELGGGMAGIMDKSLSSNFIPFRGARLAEMDSRKRKQAIDYSISLWTCTLRALRPSVIVCNGRLPFEQFTRILQREGFKGLPKWESTGWKGYNYSTAVMKRAGRGILLVYLPHLSTFAIFGRKTNPKDFRPLWKKIAKFLRK
jgi:hypothetical protein